MQPLAIIVLPEDLTLVGAVLVAAGRAYRVLTGRRLTTDHMREEHLLPWGRVLVVYDEPVAGPAARAENGSPRPAVCLEHHMTLPCPGCAADAKAGDRSREDVVVVSTWGGGRPEREG